jgi:hypothetical protein
MYKWILMAVVVVGVGLLVQARAEQPAAPVAPQTMEERVAALEAKLESAMARIADLEREIESLKSKPASASPDPKAARKPSAKKSDFDEAWILNSVWEGRSSTRGQSATSRATITITSYDDNELVFRSDHESGAIWDWHCKTDGSRFQVVRVERIRANKGVANPAPLEGVTGTGRIVNREMRLEYRMPVDNNVLHIEIVARLKQ